MTSDFHLFAKAVRNHFNEMAEDALFVVDSDRDDIWRHYLESFPVGSNPIFRARTEHDCSCCRHFIRSIGNVVAVQNGAVVSVWDVVGLPDHYQAVANAMSDYVKSLPIRDVFLTKVANHGTEVSREMIDDQVHQWSHFSVVAPSRFVTAAVAEAQGELHTTFDVLWRSVHELTTEAISTVLDLIESKSIYRGDEFLRPVREFLRLHSLLLGVEDMDKRKILAWVAAINHRGANFKSTVIGSLVEDLSKDVPVEDAVRMYESKVAPQNYRRPKALITPRMVDDAMRTIQEFGLEPSLYRRHARFTDVSVNSVLFVDNSVRPMMRDTLHEVLLKEAKPFQPDVSTAKPIGIEEFEEKVLPKTTELHLYLEDHLLGNFVSLTAPVHEDAKPLFKWNNGFAWSYDGNVTDSIKEKVKRAGGRVEGVALRVSLAWNNFDDLDIHVHEPDGNVIYYGRKCDRLDVDMNAGGGHTRQPVENVRWPKLTKDGNYQVFVNQYQERETVDFGFEVELETAGKIQSFRYSKRLNGKIPVVRILVAGGKVVTVTPSEHVVSGSAPKEKWGIKTLEMVRVNSVLISPNHWGYPVGNKHWFFILDGCRNDMPTRGIYNEFLKPELDKHRKVFEILGDKTRCQMADEQLSGVGFSSTIKNSVKVVATGPGLYGKFAVEFGR